MAHRIDMYFLFNNQRLDVNVPDWGRLASLIVDRFRTGQGFALATVNLDHLVKLAQDRAFLAAYLDHDLVVADGRPIVWLSRLARRRVALLPGSDLILPLCRLAAAEGGKVAFVGSSQPVLDRSAARLVSSVDGLQVTYLRAPSQGFDPAGEDARAILAELETAGIALCFVALGAPKQEQFAQLGRQLSPSVGFASIGAGLDFVAGHQRRAPRWVRAVALEWLWRMLSHPQRLLPRYARCFAVLPGHIAGALRLRYQAKGRAAKG
ncbi:putative N-acetylmannosaminyltransferase [Tritonibacter horizontis]|uniref:Putative N-acetylmannosaminyltransferase n=2 Tax=Tritonibacter horizontis TaxID=1768241 RepID=A0A132BVK5_9RHOB|nr:putative N-acetylmannosaminyltransferase [Tritonibacter horizontis]